MRELSAQLPTLFGRTITLPDLSSGAIPENLRTRISEQVGVTLPANFAQFTIYDAGRLQAAQEAVVTAGRGLFLFGAVAVVVSVVLRAVRREVLGQVPAGACRDGVDAAVTTVFASLRDRGTQIRWAGAILALLAYLAGPGRLPVWLRRQARRGVVAVRPGAGRAPEFIADHRDAVRVAGVVVAVVPALIFSSWAALLVIVVLLAAYEIGVTLIVRRERTSDPAQLPV